MFEYFYHEIMRRTIISFGTLFNNINIKHTNDSDNTVSVMKVPLAYSPTQKFLARLEQVEDLNKPVQMSLPRMSFEFNGLTYDTTRKVTTTQAFLSGLTTDKTAPRKTYMPVPYNMAFELNVYTKLNDDMLQIIEQILPYFQPAYTLTVDLIDTIGEKRDIPIVFEGIEMRDDYDGDFSQRRALIYTLRFTAKTYLFGPVSDVSKDIIKRTSIGFSAGDTRGSTRDITYRVDPVATRSYTDNVITTLSSDITTTTTTFEVTDASGISLNDVIVIDEENFRIVSKSGNKLSVERAYDATKASKHVGGSNVNLITASDAPLIELGDNFGFDGSF